MSQKQKVRYPAEIYKRAIELYFDLQELREEMRKARQTINGQRIRIQFFEPGFTGSASRELKNALLDVRYMSRN